MTGEIQSEQQNGENAVLNSLWDHIWADISLYLWQFNLFQSLGASDLLAYAILPNIFTGMILFLK